MKIKFIKILSLIFIASLSFQADAISLNQAKKLYLKGEYEKAMPVFKREIKRNPRSANLNQWLGVCLYETGQIEESVKYLEYAHSKNIAESARYLSQIAFSKLDYQQAIELYEQYTELLNESDKEAPSNPSPSKMKHSKAMSMMNNVEAIQIIDSINVNKQDFFKHYKISLEAGSLNSTEVLPYDKPEVETTVFMPESNSRMLWAMPDSTNCLRLMETYKLTNNKWDKYSQLSDVLNDNGNANYPFMLADGTTLYYSCDGENSLGGYDIYMSRKSLDNGTFLQPQNIGMPYNSPFNEYLLVIDEMTEIGWWATDRNQIPDSLTIYVFIPNEVRKNYSQDNENLGNLAAIKSIKDTWQEGVDYTEYLQRIKEINRENDDVDADFHFFITNGIEYKTYTQFKSAEAKSLMKKREQMLSILDKNLRDLNGLRSTYHSATANNRQKVSDKIMQLEKTVLNARKDLKALENNIRSAELSKLNK